MFWEIIRIALTALRGHMLRSLLTILSVTIGAFSIVVMLSLAEAGQATLARSVEAIGGTRLVWWVPKLVRDDRDRSRYSRGLVREDVGLIASVPYVDRATGMINLGKRTVYVTADQREQFDVVGLLPGMLDGLTWPIDEGRRFLAEEVDRWDRVCILTEGAARAFFPLEQAVGRTLTVFDKPYRVVGVLAKRKVMGIQLGFDWEKSVFVPLVTAEKREGLQSQLVLVAFTQDPGQNPTVVSLGTAKLLAKHNGVEDFQSINFGEILETFYTYFLAIRVIVGAIAAVSLFAGGIGVMNIMLVSVTERTKEIGIRKALGATVSAVILQFLGEATVLSMLGGFVGVVAGLGTVAIANAVVSHWSDYWVPVYSGVGVSVALGATMAIGLFFGAWPAFQAARLDIVECLRR